jgi:hypothetical protein
VKPPKYPQGIRTKREFIQAIKAAPANELFFSRDTMKFFGRQTFDVSEDGSMFFITFHEKAPRVTTYAVDPVTLKVTRVLLGGMP